MSATKDAAKQILAAGLAAQRGIPIEAADDLVYHIQEIIWEFEDGMGSYESVEQVLIDFGIPPSLAWVFC